MRCLSATHCLFCISLKPAGIILGFVGVIGSLYTWSMVEYERDSKLFRDIPALNNRESQISVIFFFAGLQLLTSTLWLIGIFKNKPKLMLPELILTFICNLLLGFVAGTIFLIASSSRAAGLHVVALPVYLVAGLVFHFWIVRLSLYKSMIQTDRPNYMGHELNEIRTYVYTV